MEGKGGKDRRFDPRLTIWRGKIGLAGLEGRVGRGCGFNFPTNRKKRRENWD